MGWKWFKWGNPPGEANRFIAPPNAPLRGSMIPCERPSHGLPVNLSDVPAFDLSLDACAEFEATLTDTPFGTAWAYESTLAMIVPGPRGLWSATPAQRCAAFLRAKEIK